MQAFSASLPPSSMETMVAVLTTLESAPSIRTQLPAPMWLGEGGDEYKKKVYEQKNK